MGNDHSIIDITIPDDMDVDDTYTRTGRISNDIRNINNFMMRKNFKLKRLTTPISSFNDIPTDFYGESEYHVKYISGIKTITERLYLNGGGVLSTSDTDIRGEKRKSPSDGSRKKSRRKSRKKSRRTLRKKSLRKIKA